MHGAAERWSTKREEGSGGGAGDVIAFLVLVSWEEGLHSALGSTKYS